MSTRLRVSILEVMMMFSLLSPSMPQMPLLFQPQLLLSKWNSKLLSTPHGTTSSLIFIFQMLLSLRLRSLSIMLDSTTETTTFSLRISSTVNSSILTINIKTDSISEVSTLMFNSLLVCSQTALLTQYKKMNTSMVDSHSSLTHPHLFQPLARLSWNWSNEIGKYQMIIKSLTEIY